MPVRRRPAASRHDRISSVPLRDATQRSAPTSSCECPAPSHPCNTRMRTLRFTAPCCDSAAPGFRLVFCAPKPLHPSAAHPAFPRPPAVASCFPPQWLQVQWGPRVCAEDACPGARAGAGGGEPIPADAREVRALSYRFLWSFGLSRPGAAALPLMDLGGRVHYYCCCNTVYLWRSSERH